MRALWIPWPVAVLLVPLFWLLPKRMGPHFTAVRWPGAIIGHLLWVVYGLGCMVVAYWNPLFGWAAYLTGQTSGQQALTLWPDPTVSQVARAPIAMLGSLLAGHPASNLSGWVTSGAELAIGLTMILACEAGLIVLACLLMPYATAGERGRPLLGRCVKLTLWAGTSLPILGLAFEGIELLDLPRNNLDGLWILATASYLVWFAWIWIRSGLRYGGPDEGPTWQPRHPLCEKCGYILTGLRVRDACPECGTAVALSLPDRRQPTRFAVARGPIHRSWAFVQTWRDALRTDFHKRVALRGEYAASRRFAIVMCVLGGLSPLPLVIPDMVSGGFRNLSLRFWTEIAAFCIGTSLTLILFLGLISLIALLSSRRPLREITPVVFYWSACFVPLVFAVYVSAVAIFITNRILYFQSPLPWLPEKWLDLGTLICILVTLLAPIVFIFTIVRLARAVRETRFANG